MKRILLFALALIAVGYIIIVYTGIDLGEAVKITARPYNKLRPMIDFGSEESCIRRLDGVSADYVYLGDQQLSEGGVIKNAVDYSGTTTAKLYSEESTTSSSVRLACKTAINTSKWLNEIDVKKAYHLGTYNYRFIAGSPFLSEHSFATAIDIRALDNANIIEHWNDKGDKGAKLKQAALKACKYFSNVLTPDYNADHHDHFHLDNGLGLAKFQYWSRVEPCGYRKSRKLKVPIVIVVSGTEIIPTSGDLVEVERADTMLSYP